MHLKIQVSKEQFKQLATNSFNTTEVIELPLEEIEFQYDNKTRVKRRLQLLAIMKPDGKNRVLQFTLQPVVKVKSAVRGKG